MTPRKTIEELLEMPAPDIAKMTDVELSAHLSKYFPHTRPAQPLPSALAVSLDKQSDDDDDFIARRMAAIKARQGNK